MSGFNTLEVPKGISEPGRRFSAQPIRGYGRHRLGKDAQGAPALLLATDGGEATWQTPIALEHISVQHGIDCHIVHPGGVVEEGKFTVVACTHGDPMLHEYFLRVAGPLIEA